jgi:hypothetical protein
MAVVGLLVSASAFAASNLDLDRALKELDGELLSAVGEEARTFIEMSSLVPTEARPSMYKAEETWGAYRYASCDFRASGAQGLARAKAMTQCKLGMTKSHAEELFRLSTCVRGSVLCPAKVRP